MNAKAHWENVYTTRRPDEVSWTQAVPETSLNLIEAWNTPRNAAIIDVGGGDSNLVDHLLRKGFNNITVLDISGTAIDKAKARLGENADKVQWIVSDILDFKTDSKYDVWHDRATFHFFTEPADAVYASLAAEHTKHGSKMMIATFSKQGPLKCSGLSVHQYDPDELQKIFGDAFTLTSYHFEDHTTPFNTVQNFLFASFIRK